MALFTLATAKSLLDVLDGEVTIPLEGAWVAHLDLGEDVAPELGRATLQIAREDGAPVLFEGTIVASDTFEGRACVELVAGAGAIGSNAAALHYTSAASPVAAAELVAGIVTSAGEALEEGVLGHLAGLTAPRWTRLTGESWAQALGRVAARYGLAWRILDTGAVWVGEDAWPDIAEAPFLITDDLGARVLHVAFDHAAFRPGTIVLGRRITRVTYWADGYAELHYRESDAQLLRRLLTRLSKPSSYALWHEAEVVTQNADGSLDVRLINGPIIDIPRVPFFPGVEGAKYSIRPGGTVRVGFIGGIPEGAFAFALAGDAAAERGVARLNDQVDVGTLTLRTVTQPAPLCTVEYQGPNPTDIPTVTQLAVAVTGDSVCTIDLRGRIASASEEVALR